MKVDILLPTEYITKSGSLARLSSDLTSSVENYLVGLLLEYEGGIMKFNIEGYCKSVKGIITKSKYNVLTVYTENHNLVNALVNSNIIPSICEKLKQESIGIIVDSKFICISRVI